VYRLFDVTCRYVKRQDVHRILETERKLPIQEFCNVERTLNR